MKAFCALILAFFSISEFAFGSDCEDARSAADDAHTYARRAQNADTLEELQEQAKRAMDSALEAIWAADACRCDEAYLLGHEAHRYARRAFRSDDLEEAQDYARKAKNAADEMTTAADACSADDENEEEEP